MRRACVIVLMTIAALLGACDDDQDEVCPDCEVWESCQQGVCVPAEGLCTTYLHCSDTQYCDEEEHICRGPTAPHESFFEGGTERLLFSFRGRINGPEDFAAHTGRLGEGAFTWRHDATELLMDYSAFATVAPESMTEGLPEWEGKTPIYLGASRVLSNYHNHFIVQNVMVGFDQAFLADWLSSWQFTGEVPDPMWVYITEVETFKRVDQVKLVRTCYVAARHPEERAQLFVFAPENLNFGPGEPLMVWGNFPLTGAITITPENMAEHCLFSMEGLPITAEEYAVESALAGDELSCALPAATQEPQAGDHMTISFKGTINDSATPFENFENGVGEARAIIDTSFIPTSDYYMLAYIYPQGPQNLLVIQGLGDVSLSASGLTEYTIMRLILPQEPLLTMRATGDATATADTLMAGVTIEHMEQIASGGHQLYRACPIATMDSVSTPGLVGLCHPDEGGYVAGDPLELAATLPLTDDASVLGVVFDTTEPCYCFLDYNSYRIDCSEFEQVVNP